MANIDTKWFNITTIACIFMLLVSADLMTRCQRDTDCFTSFSECSPIDDIDMIEVFKCQCIAFYIQQDDQCTPGMNCTHKMYINVKLK